MHRIAIGGLRAFHSPSPSDLMPVLSMRRFSGPLLPRNGRLTFGVFCLRHKVLKSGTAQSSPTSRSRLSTNPVRLPKRHPEQHLQGQTGLDRRIAELRVPAAFASRSRCPDHLRIKPDRQRSTLPQAVIARRPVRGLILRRGPAAHALQLSRWIHNMNPLSSFVQQSSLDLLSVVHGAPKQIELAAWRREFSVF